MRTIVIISFLFLSIPSYSQRSKLVNGADENMLLYKKEWSIGVKLLSNGWGFFFEKAKIKNIYKTRFFQVGFSQIKHWKETKQQSELTYIVSNSNLDPPGDFYYGLQNMFFTLRGGYGNRKIIADKAEKNGVRLSLSYMAGITLGMLKPYYLELAYPVQDNDPNYQTYVIVSQRYSAANHDKFLDWYSIAGASDFTYGITEMEFVPGLYGKFGLNFDWATREKIVKALEVGVTADFYYKNIPLMVSNDNKFYFIAAYISFQLGKRS